MPELEAVRIRPATVADSAEIAAIYAPYVRDTAISFESVAPDVTEMARRFAETTAFYPWLVAEIDGVVAGYAYAGRHSARAAYDWSADVTVYLAPGSLRRGLGRQLYGGLFRLLRAQGLHALFAVIALPNEASVALHRACGFSDVGICREAGYKFAAWWDVFLMGAVLGDRSTAVESPKPVTELGNLEAFL